VGLRRLGQRLVLPALLGLGGGYYPFYYPHYPSYGYGAWYNRGRGVRRTAVAYGPYGGAGVSARYNPRTGTYSRGAVAWGPYGARGAGQATTRGPGPTRRHARLERVWQLGLDLRASAAISGPRRRASRTGHRHDDRVTQGSGGGTAVSRNPSVRREHDRAHRVG